MANPLQFAVTDFETTGLSPSQHHRVVEVAVVKIDVNGLVLDEFTTLVNPERDMGPTHVHGIKARDVLNAPTFAEIAGDVLLRLDGCVFVAHNASFDLSFLRSELVRMGHEIPVLPSVCTMRLARKVDSSIPSRKLGQLCEHFGIPCKADHSAYNDACATAALFSRLANSVCAAGSLTLDLLGADGPLPTTIELPKLRPSGKTWKRSACIVATEQAVSYLSSLVARLPAATDLTPEVDEYLAFLDRVLEDRRVTDEEANSLITLASDIGLVREQVQSAHERYMTDLYRVALEDGHLSEGEAHDLKEVGTILGVSNQRLNQLLSRASSGCQRGIEKPGVRATPLESMNGKTICFTGQMTCQIDGQVPTRSFAENLASQKGMVVKQNVNKSLDYLVVADPDTMSTKARKARELEVRIVAEPVFWRMIGIEID